MTTSLEARIRYYAHDCWMHPSLLGWRRIFEYQGKTVEIRFPNTPDEFSAKEHERELMPTPSFIPVATTTDPASDNRVVAVRLICVTVFLTSNLPPERPKDPFEGEYGAMAESALNEAIEIAGAITHDFLRWLRASTRQVWLGLIAEPPQQYGRAGLFYSDTGEAVMGLGPTQSHVWRSAQLRLEPEDLESMADHLAQGQDIPVAQALLADAWHLNTGSARPDIQRSVIIAAIACEVRTKDFMREHVSQERAALLHMMLDRASNLAFLLHDIFLATFDTSLKAKAPELYEHVRLLSKQRNSVVHEGRLTADPSLKGGPAQVANNLFDWLGTCLDGVSSTPSTEAPLTRKP